MPIYEFRCQKCEDLFELLVMSQSDEVEMRCPKCGAEEFERVMSRASHTMAPGAGDAPGVSSQSRSCNGGSCTTWDLPGPTR